MIFDAFDVVVTQFPFVDRNAEKKRPAVVLSRRDHHGRTGVVLVAMITTGRASQWPLDVPVDDLAAAGLKHPCVVRMKLASLDTRRIERAVGRLGQSDRQALTVSLSRLMPMDAAGE